MVHVFATTAMEQKGKAQLEGASHGGVVLELQYRIGLVAVSKNGSIVKTLLDRLCLCAVPHHFYLLTSQVGCQTKKSQWVSR